MNTCHINDSLNIDIKSIEESIPQTDRSKTPELFLRIKQLLNQEDAVLISHYYVDEAIQALAEETGGIVADSLEMARFGSQHPAKTLIVCGVKFMGETAKILSPEKRVLMPRLDATCSLDLSCQADAFKAFCDQHPERTVVVYANTSAEVKALSDWVVTSSVGLDIVKHLHAQGESIIWAPDRHLGSYIEAKTGVDMLKWNGLCIVHDAFKLRAVSQLQQEYPEAALLVHPESPAEVISKADAVGSTSQIIKAAQTLPYKQFIVATDKGIFYKLQQLCPDKEFIEIPTGGKSAECVSCAHCPWMAMNVLENVESTLIEGTNEIHLPENIIERARLPLERMLAFKR